MNWTGTWKNQYGSILDITSDEGGNIAGWFTSAVDGGIKDARIRVSGFHAADRLTFCLAGGPIVAAWTGLLRHDRLETLWHVAASERRTGPVEEAGAANRQLDIFEAFTTGADTFIRIDRGR
ncbi:avidin/streptavidin family protein [Pendulispora albinea]|uniref:Avidin/streptavidin family protein n=1 Tax=Pendulispora albinea TaxID=2741071 RepID=A0ABZ2LVT7_9BACT